MEGLGYISLKHLSDVSNVKLPRIVLISNSIIINLHGFSDTSKGTYGLATYLYFTKSQGTINPSVLRSKSKVFSLKALTISRV